MTAVPASSSTTGTTSDCAEVSASRRRILAAADESRRAIEQGLHEGAQQHLVALAVKIGLAEQVSRDDPAALTRLLRELRQDVQVTITQVRELAHEIFPPLLRQHGLGEALRGAASRCPLPCTVSVEVPRRFEPEVESAVYFGTAEALREFCLVPGAARITVGVRLAAGGDAVEFAVEVAVEVLDGAGGRVTVAEGHRPELIGVQDRLAALGGRMASGGTWVRGCVPVPA